MNAHERVLESIVADDSGYLLNDFEDAAVRFEKRNGENVWFLKLRGKEEFHVQRSHRLVFDAILESVTLTKDEYDAF